MSDQPYSGELLRVTPDGNILVNDNGTLVETGVTVPMPLPNGADGASRVAYALGMECAYMRRMMMQ